MSKIALVGDVSGTGTLSIVAPNTSTDRTLTLPDNTGTIITTASTFAGTGPAFSAYMSATQSITSTVYTKVQFNTEDFDTASCYDTSTYRFTPNVAGYYQINYSMYGTGTSLTQTNMAIYKNGSFVKGSVFFVPSGTQIGGFTAAIIYCNGTTDYIEAYGFITGTSPIIQNGVLTHFNGAMVRAA
jgi:hypothetical protein